MWSTMTWAVYDGDVPVMLALRSILGLENDSVVEKSVVLEDSVGSRQRSTVEAQSRVP